MLDRKLVRLKFQARKGKRKQANVRQDEEGELRSLISRSSQVESRREGNHPP